MIRQYSFSSRGIWKFVLASFIVLNVHTGLSAATLFQLDQTSVSVAPGGTFTLSLSISTDVASYGISYSVLTTAGSGALTLQARDISGSSYNTVYNTDGTILPLSLSSAASSPDLGASLATFDTPLTTGTYSISKLTFRVDSLASVGAYTLSITNGMLDDGGFGQTLSDLAITLNIANVPEPGTVWFLLLALPFIFCRRRILRHCGFKEANVMADRPINKIPF